MSHLSSECCNTSRYCCKKYIAGYLQMFFKGTATYNVIVLCMSFVMADLSFNSNGVEAHLYVFKNGLSHFVHV